MMRHGRRYFVISPGSIPLNIKVSRDVVFTLQKKLFILTVVRGYIRCEMTSAGVSLRSNEDTDILDAWKKNR